MVFWRKISNLQKSRAQYNEFYMLKAHTEPFLTFRIICFMYCSAEVVKK